MRILWSSNAPWAASGYGVQTHLFVPRIKNLLGHDMAILAFFGLQAGVLEIGGIKTYSGGSQPYGLDVQVAHAADFGADITITLIDSWVSRPETFPPDHRWCPWFPVDHEPVPPIVAQKVKQSFAPICYSLHAQTALAECGIDALYVPHGYDPQVYYPVPMAVAREQSLLPKDRFIVGMVAANHGVPSRKSFPQCLEAFAQFAKKRSDAVLYLHSVTGTAQDGAQRLNLPELCQVLGIADKVIFANDYRLQFGYSAKEMAAVMNSLDVLLTPSMGEGFGVPILEAQACGVPVITGDWTAMSELTWKGHAIPRSEAFKFYTTLASYQYIATVDAIRDRLEWCYNDRQGGLRGAPGQCATYEADFVTRTYWGPVLEQIKERMADAQSVRQIVQASAGGGA